MICCVCLKNLKDTIKIFKGIGLRLKVAEMLSKHFWFEPNKNDAVLSNICLNCWEIVKNFNELYVSAEEEHRLLTEAGNDSTESEPEEKPSVSGYTGSISDRSTVKKASVGQSTAANSTANKPTNNKRNSNKPGTTKTNSNKLETEASSANKPTTSKTNCKKPESEESTAHKPTANKSTNSKGNSKKPETEESTTHKPTTSKTKFNKPETEESTANKRKTNKTNSKKPATAEPSAGGPTAVAPASEEPANGGPKPPAIILEEATNFVPLMDAMAEVDDGFITHCKSNDIMHIHCKDAKSYRAAVRFLKENNMKFHYFQLKEDKPYRVVVNNLTCLTPNAEIKEYLANLGHEVLYIGWNKHKKSELQCFIDLKRQKNNSEIFKITYICRQKVTIKKPEKIRDLVQCHRCQGYGHTRSYCVKDPVCVKCSNGHLTADCKQDKDVPAKCVHCAGTHPANFRGCEFYQDMLKRFKPHTDSRVVL